ncbi:hypothetical protein [Chryseobacterium vrystaatense]|uniref:Lipoprotein n=1 Tax=Chryseobacterium vrystaatense TaxID=307480 RepID=A0A1M5H9I1_9FLAO|nr:hypothetical protein [Chryseobacterium vrystaatense]SHG12670.1 hypothetical protein SAMN02787073_3627 [Chryseobacterium vrystaatense]
MRKQTVFLIPLLSLTLLFTSCGQEDTKIEVGKEFKIDQNPITIVKLEEAKVLHSAKEQMMKIAPKGKKYIYLEVKNPKNDMIFLKAFNKENELKSEDDLHYYSHDIDAGFNDAYYLVDENTAIDKIVITTPSETQYVVLKPGLTKSKIVIPEEVQHIVDSYSPEKEIGLLQGFAPYVANGKNVLDIAKQQGEYPINRLSTKAELTYFTEDGKKYIFTITDILKLQSKVTTYWEGGKITDIEVADR